MFHCICPHFFNGRSTSTRKRLLFRVKGSEIYAALQNDDRIILRGRSYVKGKPAGKGTQHGFGQFCGKNEFPQWRELDLSRAEESLVLAVARAGCGNPRSTQFHGGANAMFSAEDVP